MMQTTTMVTITTTKKIKKQSLASVNRRFVPRLKGNKTECQRNEVCPSSFTGGKRRSPPQFVSPIGHESSSEKADSVSA